MGISYSHESVSDRPLRIAIVGDVHGVWDKVADKAALRFLRPDLVLFVGDFAGRDVVKAVGGLDMPKAAILGNHDSWGGRRVKQLLTGKGDDVEGEQKLIQALCGSHVGFGRKDLPLLKLSVVGGRPFSAGAAFDKDDCAAMMYNVDSLKESSDKITSCGVSAPKDHSLIFLAHNGPKGLGSRPDDLCGRDFKGNEDGDYGDVDLAEAISNCRSTHRIPLVVFGHMHKELSGNQGYRKMVKCGDDGTVYVNAAVVPRQRLNGTERNFTMVELTEDKVTKVAEMWVTVKPAVALAEETILYSN